MRKIILASKSERRQEILRLLPIEFTVEAIEVDEAFVENLGLFENLLELAAKKGALIAEAHPDAIVLSGDTIVEYDGNIIGKPSDLKDAKRILRMLSGTEHHVFTGMCIAIKAENVKIQFIQETKIWMKELSDEEIDKYLEIEKPLDKAGAYGIQGFAGAFVQKIEGDYFNVVGMPLNKIYEELIKLENV